MTVIGALDAGRSFFAELAELAAAALVTAARSAGSGRVADEARATLVVRETLDTGLQGWRAERAIGRAVGGRLAPGARGSAVAAREERREAQHFDSNGEFHGHANREGMVGVCLHFPPDASARQNLLKLHDKQH